MSTTTPTWLITGTSNGFGLALSQHILRASHNLISISRHAQPHETLTSLTNDTASTLHHLQLDLSIPNESNIKSAISTFLTSHPSVSIDILVNNAATTAFGPLETTPTSTTSKLMTVNFWSPLWLIQAVLPNMRTSKNGVGKVVVNISSTQGLTCDPSELGYEASKHALEGMNGVLAAEVRTFGIRVVVANLGSFRTAFALGDSADKGGDDAQHQSGADDPYQDAEHPVRTRMDMVSRLASMPGVARGDTAKGARVLFDAVMQTESSKANEALQVQRDAIERGAMGGVSKIERLILGSDAQLKIGRQSQWFGMQLESCRIVSNEADADGVKPLPAAK